jgi:hypothetical protein
MVFIQNIWYIGYFFFLFASTFILEKLIYSLLWLSCECCRLLPTSSSAWGIISKQSCVKGGSNKGGFMRAGDASKVFNCFLEGFHCFLEDFYCFQRIFIAVYRVLLLFRSFYCVLMVWAWHTGGAAGDGGGPAGGTAGQCQPCTGCRRTGGAAHANIAEGPAADSVAA